MAAAPVDIKAYVFTHDEDERRRLDGQHLIVQRAFGRDQPGKVLHPLVKPTQLRAVLDIGAGSCAWIMDVARALASSPWGSTDMQASTSTKGKAPSALADNGLSPPTLFACDITSAKFPPQPTLARFGIRAFEHDIRNALPSGMGAHFSLISIRLVLVWLTVDDIKIALRNVHNALAPNGRILLTEAQMFCFYEPEEAQPSGNVQNRRLNRDSYLWPLNVAIQDGRRRAGLLVDTDRQLPPLLAECGFRTVSASEGTIPVGEMAKRMLGNVAPTDVAAAASHENHVDCEDDHLDAGRYIPYSVKSFGPPSPSATKVGFFSTSDALGHRAPSAGRDTSSRFPHVHPAVPLHPPLSPADLETIDAATRKMFCHFAGMMREAWERGCLPGYDGEIIPPPGEGGDGEKRFKEVEERVMREFDERGCHYGVREWVLEVV